MLQASDMLPLPAVTELSDGALGLLALDVPIVRLSADERPEMLSAASPALTWIECAPAVSGPTV